MSSSAFVNNAPRRRPSLPPILKYNLITPLTEDHDENQVKELHNINLCHNTPKSPLSSFQRMLSRQPFYSSSLTTVNEIRNDIEEVDDSDESQQLQQGPTAATAPVVILGKASRDIHDDYYHSQSSLSTSISRSPSLFEEDKIDIIHNGNNTRIEGCLIEGRIYRKHTISIAPSTIAGEGRCRRKSEESHRTPYNIRPTQFPFGAQQLLGHQVIPNKNMSISSDSLNAPSRIPNSPMLHAKSGDICEGKRRVSSPVPPSHILIPRYVVEEPHKRSLSVTTAPATTPSGTHTSASSLLKSMFLKGYSKSDGNQKIRSQYGKASQLTNTDKNAPTPNLKNEGLVLCAECSLSVAQLSGNEPTTSTSSANESQALSVPETGTLEKSRGSINSGQSGKLVCLVCHKNIHNSLKKSPPEKLSFAQRFRSLSISGGRSNTALNHSENEEIDNFCSGPPADPSKLPKSTPHSDSLSFTTAHLKPKKKPSRKVSCPSQGATLVVPRPTAFSNAGNSTLIASHNWKSEENVFAQISTGEEYKRQRLFRQIRLECPSPIASKQNQIDFELMRVSENDRFMFLSRSMYKDPSVYLSEDGNAFFDRNEMFAAFFHHSTAYDVLPDSGKLIVVDSKLELWRCIRAMFQNSIRVSPVWSSKKTKYIGLLSMMDFARILHYLHSLKEATPDDLEELESKSISYWLKLLSKHEASGQENVLNQTSVTPETDLLSLTQYLYNNKLHFVPVMDDIRGNILGLLTYKRLFRFLYLKRHQLFNAWTQDVKKPTWLTTTIEESSLWKEDKDFVFVTLESTLQEALAFFIKCAQHALPVVDSHAGGVLVNVYTKSDLLNLAMEDSYHELKFSIKKALIFKKMVRGIPNVVIAVKETTIEQLMNLFGQNEVQSIVLVDNLRNPKPIGLLYVKDLLNYLILKEARC